VDYPGLDEFFLVAEAILGLPADRLIRATRIGLAESALAAPRATFGGVEFYPAPAVKAGILGARIIRNHPLPDGNKRVGLVLMLDFIERNGMKWKSPSQDDIADTIERLAAGEVSQEAFCAWVARNVE
jgi:death-on-curing protein